MLAVMRTDKAAARNRIPRTIHPVIILRRKNASLAEIRP